MLRKIQEKHPAIGVDHRVELWLIPIFNFFYYLFTMSLFSMHSVLLYEDIFRVFSFIYFYSSELSTSFYLRKIQQKNPGIDVGHRVELLLIPILLVFLYNLFTMSLFSMHSVLLYEDFFRVFGFIPNFQRFFITSVFFIFKKTSFKKFPKLQ